MKNSTSILKASSFISILFTGLFSGLMACFLIAIDPTLHELDGATYTTVMQKLIEHADHPPLVPLMVIISLVAPLVSLYLLRAKPRSRVFVYTLAGFLLFLIVLFITVVLNVPINTTIQSWDPHNLPNDWATKRDAWHTLNLFRTPAATLALFCHIWAAQSLWQENGK